MERKRSETALRESEGRYRLIFKQMQSIVEGIGTAKEAGKGLGLGLSISLSIVKGFGGIIHASNHKDGGALFTVAFPRLVSPGRAEE
ncbi:MAG: hypothetical protein HZA02_06225 [Nitrospinae bacterium]|nr:hypothetical protein [Nitrospinota bacterium]